MTRQNTDRSSDKANTLDLFLTSNPNIYSKPIVDSPLGHSDHCLITLQHDILVSHHDKSFSTQKVFYFSKADWDSLGLGISNDPSYFASFITNGMLLGMDLFIPSSFKKNSPKWFNSQCAKAVKTKNHRFKQWKFLQTPQSRALFVQARNICSKTINGAKTSFVNRINHKIACCQTGSRSFWSLAKVVSQNFCYSSFPPLKNNSGSTSCTPSSKPNLFASIFASNSNLDDEEPQPPLYTTSTLTMPPVKFSTRKVRKTLLQLNTSNSKDLCSRTRTCSQQTLSAFLLCWYISFFLETCPRFPYPQKRGQVRPFELSPNCNHFTYL